MQITRTATVETEYPPHLAIQLFTAEGEKYWLGDTGWNPTFPRGDGYSQDDVFAVGPSVFLTVAYDKDAGRAKYARVEAGKTAGTVEVLVSATDSGSIANVTYKMASLSKEGDRALEAMTEEAFATEMASWQARIVENNNAIQKWLASRN